MTYFTIYYIMSTLRIKKKTEQTFDRHTYITLVLLAIYCFSKSALQCFSDVCYALYFGSRIGDPNTFLYADDHTLKWPDSYQRWFLNNKLFLMELIDEVQTVGIVLRNAGLIVNITRWIMIVKARDYVKEQSTLGNALYI